MPDDPDGTDRWVFDDDFVRAGQHEPPARTRAAIARFGGQRTSWRQPGDPVGAAPVRSSRPIRRRRWLRSGLTLLAIGAVAALLLQHRLATSGTRAGGQLPFRSGPTISARPPSTSVAGQPTDAADEVHGITPATRIGTCFSTPPGGATPGHTGPIDLSATACARPHTFELIAIEQAADSTAYPDESYWRGAVGPACQREFASYTGVRGVPVTADGRTSSFFRPMRTGWALGDRTVYCLAASATAIRGSVSRAGTGG